MTDRARLRLGPDGAPPLKRGDRTICLYGDGTVLITSWSDARIPRPRCRALDSTGGGPGLLVDEELARAVRHEAVAAVNFWWEASETAVQNWRRALGVGRTDNEATTHLVLAAAEKGAEAVKVRGWTEEDRQQRRRIRPAETDTRYVGFE